MPLVVDTAAGLSNFTYTFSEKTMTETKQTALAYPRLCLAYFCQFAIWGAWAGALGEYAASALKFGGGEIGSLYNAIPFGAIIAPLFIGPIADRYFSAQKVMSVLHLVGGLALLACGWLCVSGQQSFALLMGLMLLSGICFMPTLALINSVVFKHLPNASMAPLVFVFGTLGWIAVNLFIAAFCDGAKTPYFFLVAGGVGLFLALYAWTLPDTPPKGAPAPGENSGGPGVLTLFRDFSFVIFVLCAFAASIPACNYFFPAIVPFLTHRGYPSPVALNTLNQFSEIFFMLALPFCIPRFGLKNVLLIGMGAWAVRYFCFAQPGFSMALIGLMLHGFCYSFLYVASYMYAEKVAPAHLKSSAQSMMVFLLLGVGQVLGGFGYGYMSEVYSPKWIITAVDKSQLEPTDGKIPNVEFRAKVPIPAWEDAEDSLFQYLDLAKQVNKLRGKEEEESTNLDLGKLLDGKPLTPQSIDAMDESLLVQNGVTISRLILDEGIRVQLVDDNIVANVRYTKENLKTLAAKIAEKDDFSLTREDWLAAQARDWKNIFQIPAIFIAVCFVVFLVLGRDPDAKGEKEKG